MRMTSSIKISFRFRAMVTMTALAILANAVDAAESLPEGTYIGITAGRGNALNEINDVDGFAYWLQPDWMTSYARRDTVGGVLAGRRFTLGDTPLRVEFGFMDGSFKASSNQLDPFGLDETVRTHYHWISTAQLGLDVPLGPAVATWAMGLALARVSHSVTDLDTICVAPCPANTASRTFRTIIDPDDSFSFSKTRLAPVVSAAIEYPIDQKWSVRAGLSYIILPQSTHSVNRVGDGRCGRGGPRRPCPYKIDSRLVSAQLSLIRYLGS